MALGIFCTGALGHLPFGAVLTRPLAALVCAAWLATALALARSLWRAGVAARTRPIVESFGIGTWVAGTAIAAECVRLALPQQRPGALVLVLAGAALWVWFFPMAVRNLVRLCRTSLRPSGLILLSTVATQAVALSALDLFSGAGLARALAAILMALGVACYAVGAPLIVGRHARGGWHLADDWSNANCILHGALSITGLAAVRSGFFAGSTILALWFVVLGIFALVELVEAVRLAARVRAAGWRNGVLVYDLSQWARNFTFGMFYAFTIAFAARYPIAAAQPAAAAVQAIGAYVVLAFLLIEAALICRNRVKAILAHPQPRQGRL